MSYVISGIFARADTLIKTEFKIESFRIEPSYNYNEYKFEIFYDVSSKKYYVFYYEYDLNYHIEGDSAKFIKYTNFKGDTVVLNDVHLPKYIFIKKLYTNKFYISAKTATISDIKVTILYHGRIRYSNKVADNNGFVTLEKTAPY